MSAKRKKSAKPRTNRLQHKQMEDSLQKSALLYKTLMENIHLGITLIDTNHRIVTTNIGQGRLFRKPSSKFVGKYCFKEFEKRSKVCSHCPGTRSMATGLPAEVQTEGVRDDGSHISARLRTFPVFESDGSISGFIEIVEDITEYKRTKESLKESEERFKAIFDNAADGILLADAKTKKFYLGNKAICKMLGYRTEEIRNLTVSKIHPKKHLSYVIEQFDGQIRREITVAEDVPVKRKNGSVFYADINSFPIVLDEKKYLMGIFRNITARKQAEEKLKESEERFKAIFDNAPDGIILVDTESKKFHLGNKVLCKMLGYKSEEIKNLTVSDIHRKEHLPFVLEQFERLAKGETSLAEDIPVKRKNGSNFYADISAFPMTFGEKKYLAAIFRDITERKKAEEELRQAEAKYRTLVEQIPAVTYTTALDKSSTTSYISPQILELAGFSPKECGADPYLWQKRLHPEDRQRVIDELQRSKKGKHSFNCEYRLFSKDGRIVWCRDEAVVVRDSSGRPLMLQGVMFDITAQKQAEEKLKESEERFKAIFDSAADGILLADVKSKEFYLGNKTMCRMLGYTPEEIKNLTVSDIHSKERLPFVLEQFKKLARKEITLAEDILVKRRDGSVFYADISSFTIMFGGKTYLTGIFRDITDRKKAEEELRQAEAKYKTLVEQVPAVTYTATLDKASTTTYVSPQILTLIGFSSREYKADPDLWRKQLHPDDRRRVLDCLYQSRKSKHPFQCEYRMFSKDGRVVWCRDEAVVVRDGSGKPLMLQGVMFDITAQKQAEEELNIFREKMAQAERLASLGTLSATIAHELNQPLTVISLSIENSLEDLKAASCPKDVLDVLKEGLDEVSNATSIVDRFRNYARQSSRKILCETNLDAIAGRIIRLLDKTAQHAKMSLNLKGIDKLPAVYSNEKDLEQLFFALVENAIQAADDKKSHRLTIEGLVKDKNVELRFRDNCSGIAPENLGRLFEPFFTTHSDGGGTGLGLPIVQRIVSDSGGKIRVRSRPGKGTTFYVTLPIHPEMAK